MTVKSKNKDKVSDITKFKNTPTEQDKEVSKELGVLAKTQRNYFLELLKQGFTSDEAIELTSGFLQSILIAKEIGEDNNGEIE